MKKFLLLSTILICAFGAFSQDTTKVVIPQKKSGPSSQLAAKRKEMDKIFAKYSRDHIVVDLNATNWIYNPNTTGTNAMNGMRTAWFSRGINIYFNWDFRIPGSRVSFAPGIGYANTNIYSRHAMVQDTSGTHFTPLAYGSDTTAKINKIALQYVEIPLELRIRTNPDKLGNSWKVAIGFKAGVRVDAHTKIKLIEDGITHVFVERRYEDFNLFRAGPTIRVGYSFFNITAYYGVLNMFKPGLGPTANEFALGISFMAL
jgi:hypothetical protein